VTLVQEGVAWFSEKDGGSTFNFGVSRGGIRPAPARLKL